MGTASAQPVPRFGSSRFGDVAMGEHGPSAGERRRHVVKHTGDGIMASFADVAASVQCARAIQQAFEAFNLASKEKLRVRIGIDVGEPIADSNDLFGATVQLAARLCQLAEPDAILVSSAVQDRIRDRLHVTNIGPCHLKRLPAAR